MSSINHISHQLGFVQTTANSNSTVFFYSDIENYNGSQQLLKSLITNSGGSSHFKKDIRTKCFLNIWIGITINTKQQQNVARQIEITTIFIILWPSEIRALMVKTKGNQQIQHSIYNQTMQKTVNEYK